MAAKSGARKPWYQSTARMLTEVGPYKITKIVPSQECYRDKQTLQAYNIGVFTSTFKIEEDKVWSVTILPEEIRQIQVHTDAMAIYTKVGLESYFSLPAWGMDVQKAHQLITTLQEDGTATIQDAQGQEVTVSINEETIRDALMIPIGNQSLMIRN